MTTSCRVALVALAATWLILLSTPAQAALISRTRRWPSEADGGRGREGVSGRHRPDEERTPQPVAEPLLKVAERAGLAVPHPDDPRSRPGRPRRLHLRHRGLMEQMPDRELAFVLAHEIQHVEKRHSIRRWRPPTARWAWPPRSNC